MSRASIFDEIRGLQEERAEVVEAIAEYEDETRQTPLCLAAISAGQKLLAAHDALIEHDQRRLSMTEQQVAADLPRHDALVATCIEAAKAFGAACRALADGGDEP